MDEKRIDELGVKLGRSLAELVQNALGIVAEASKGAPLWVNVGTAASSFTKPVEEEKPEPKKTTRKRATTKTPKAEAPKAEAPKAEAPKAEAPKAEAPKAEATTKNASLLDIQEVGQKIMGYKSAHPWVEDECIKAMNGKVLATLKDSEIQTAYDELQKILARVEGSQPYATNPFA